MSVLCDSLSLIVFVVYNNDVRAHIRYERIWVTTFKRYPAASSTRVAHNISLALPDRFALVFGRPTFPEARYVAVFTKFPSKNAADYCAACSVMSLLEDETTQGAEEDVCFLQFLFSVFEKDDSNVVALIGDNCSVDRGLSKWMGGPLYACELHGISLL